MKNFKLFGNGGPRCDNVFIALAFLSVTQAMLGSSAIAEASNNDGLVLTAQMQIYYTAPNTALESYAVSVRLQSCDENRLQLTPFKDGENELEDSPNVIEGGCIELDKSSIPFDRIKVTADAVAPGGSMKDDYDLIGIDAYFDTTYRKPAIDLTDCLTPPSQVFFNKINPRESYAHCAPDSSQAVTPGLTINSPANLYLLLFKYENMSKSANLPNVTIIVGLVE